MFPFLSCLVPLRMWEVSNDALFYAFPRPKLQPYWATDEKEFTFVDPCHGRYMYLISVPHTIKFFRKEQGVDLQCNSLWTTYQC